MKSLLLFRYTRLSDARMELDFPCTAASLGEWGEVLLLLIDALATLLG